METLSCSAGYGEGGLGLHLAQLIEDARSCGELAGYYTVRARPGDEQVSTLVPTRLVSSVLTYTPVRFSRGWRDYAAGELFDRSVASLLAGRIDTFVGFVGKSLHSFEKARALGARRLVLVAANSHLRKVKLQHEAAYARHGLERSWLIERQVEKALREYEQADSIIVNSEYARASFLAEGFPPEKLERVYFRPAERFQPPDARRGDGGFRVVYTGSLTVAKGVPLLVEAFHRLPDTEARLTLVGGVATRPMRKYIEGWVARDSRIEVRPGDPLPHLQSADLYVHPSYEDGFAYAPAEALATGLPVIVTEDTGMKEYVNEGLNGYVVPTGDGAALYECLHHLSAARFRLTSQAVPDFGRAVSSDSLSP